MIKDQIAFLRCRFGTGGALLSRSRSAREATANNTAPWLLLSMQRSSWRSLAVLHGQELHSNPRDTKKWMRYSRKSRKKLARKFGLIEGGKEISVDDHLPQLDLKQPERTYSGKPTGG